MDVWSLSLEPTLALGSILLLTLGGKSDYNHKYDFYVVVVICLHTADILFYILLAILS